MSEYDVLIKKIVEFGNRDNRISAIIMIGSQARGEKSADKYSDLDLIIITKDVDYFVQSNDWISEIDTFHIVFVEKTVDDSYEKRVMFAQAKDVDFVFITEAEAINSMANGESDKLLLKGYKVLVDKKGIASSIPDEVQSIEKYTFPLESDYSNVVNDFWYHAIWTGKKLLRGELWAAKFCLDGNMKHKILWMLELYEHAKKGIEYDTWYSGRFVDTWADKDIIKQLAEAFAHYDKQDMICALEKTMILFRSLATEVGTSLAYSYPVNADNYSTLWVKENLR